MIALASFHAKVKRMKITRVITKGFSTGFVGLLSAVALQFAEKSLINWQTWALFTISLVILIHYKRDVWWLFAGAVLFSAFFI